MSLLILEDTTYPKFAHPRSVDSLMPYFSAIFCIVIQFAIVYVCKVRLIMWVIKENKDNQFACWVEGATEKVWSNRCR